MQVTNRTRMSDHIVQTLVAINSEYDRGLSDVTATQLTKPPMIVRLEHQHSDELTQDAADMAYAVLGTAVHSFIEKRGGKDDIREQRFYAPIEGVMLGGQIDYYCHQDKLLADYKVTSVWSVLGGLKSEWEQQLNVNAFLLRQAGYEVERATIVAFYRDWSEAKMRTDSDYPRQPIQEHDITLWHPLITETWIRQGIAQLMSDSPRECFHEERWPSTKPFAVKKKGRKTAVKLFEMQPDAEAFIAAADDKSELTLETRDVRYKRCDRYCLVRQWCPTVNRRATAATALDLIEDLL